MKHYSKGKLFFSLFIFLTWIVNGSLSAQEENSGPSLYEKTLYNDISTASYYELLNWCRELELDTKGASEALRKELYKYYGLTIDSSTADSSGSTIIKILSADHSEYYTVDEIGEDYIRIAGRVNLIVRQTAENITHTIEADSVIFNQSANRMTASGNIIYTKEQNGKKEEYSGDNFTFNVKSWKGVILQGDFKKIQKVNDKDVEFIFSGEAIKKGEGDVVVLDRGSISSCEEEEPHYQIKARKIWILGPDEWAIVSGFLYVGHVPLLYIPFYHLPGNDLFFNPVIGEENRRGFFIETTTYLLGQKEKSEEDSSIFINVADSDESYTLEPVGLYLFKIKGEPAEKSGDYIKYKLDYYSRLGGYTAFEGNIAKAGPFKSLTFDLGLGLTKSIAGSSSTGYTNYFDENDYEASWNTSDFFGVQLPFRWGLSFGFSLLSFNASFKYLSDPFFNSDFSTRSENFDWLNYLLAQTTQEEDVEASSTGSCDWSLSGNISVPDEWAGNYIKSFSFNPVKMNLAWASKSNSDPELTDPYSPAREFFYPSIITWPQTTLTISGDLLNIKDSVSALKPADSKKKDESLTSPWESGTPEENAAGEPAETGLENPSILGDLTVADKSEDYNIKLDYSFSSYFSFYSYTNSTEWDSPSEIDFSILKSLLTNNNSLTMNYSLNFAQSMFSFNGKNILAINYLDYFKDFTDDEAAKELSGRKIKWTNTFLFTFKPFKDYPYFKASTLSYTFNTDLYNYLYNTDILAYENDWIQWNEDYITVHNASMNFDFNNTVFHSALSFATTLPPREIEQSVSPSVELTVFHWTNSITGKAVYKDSEWKLDPATFHSSFSPLDWLSLSADLTYNFEDETFSRLTSTLKLWKFSGTYIISYATDYEWNKDTSVLEDHGKDFIPSSLALNFNYTYKIPAFWKNRITMDGSVVTTFNMNLQQYNLTSLGFDFKYNLHIYEFLDLKFTLKSSNNHMFLYFPGLRDYYGVTGDYSFFSDLFKSFNIFSPGQQDRYDSFFNMDSLEVSLVHKLHDWDLEMTYTGLPIINKTDLTSDWDSTFTLLVRWNPIEKLKVKTSYEDESWNFDTEFEN